MNKYATPQNYVKIKKKRKPRGWYDMVSIIFNSIFSCSKHLMLKTNNCNSWLSSSIGGIVRSLNEKLLVRCLIHRQGSIRLKSCKISSINWFLVEQFYDSCTHTSTHKPTDPKCGSARVDSIKRTGKKIFLFFFRSTMFDRSIDSLNIVHKPTYSIIR